jgi:CheY-like chemotaxis protein
LHGFRILVVDDEADSRELCAEICRDAGAEVSMAGSAQEALMEIHRRHPDAVISDIAMPTYDGLWLIRQIRVLPGCDSTRLPAIALSALARESDRQASLTAGFHEHMAKPMDPGGLLRKLHELLVSKS